VNGKYSVELFREGGEGAGIERMLVRRDDLTTLALYCTAAFTYPERLIMLCDKARVLAWSYRLDTMPR
jgi:hypothetical protein